jgi:hypothetical protein
MLISSADRCLLDQYQVKIEVDAVNACGIIIFQGRHFKVTLLTRPSGKDDAEWQIQELEENQMKETASKVAVMLLKKELLQEQKAQPLEVQIHAQGFANLSDNKLMTSHKDNDAKKDTRKDYQDLMKYLASIGDQEIIEDDNEENVEEEVVDAKLDVKEELVPEKEQVSKTKKKKLPKLPPAATAAKTEKEQEEVKEHNTPQVENQILSVKPSTKHILHSSKKIMNKVPRSLFSNSSVDDYWKRLQNLPGTPGLLGGVAANLFRRKHSPFLPSQKTLALLPISSPIKTSKDQDGKESKEAKNTKA